VLGGSRESARLALDKEATLQRARQAGFATPDYHVVCDPGEALRAARDVGYPCVLKPTRSYARFCGGLRSARLVFAQNRRQLSDEVARFRRAGFQRLLLQSWVPGRSIGVAAVLHRGAVLGFGAREAFSQYPVRGGSAVWRATVKPSEPGVQDALELLRTVSFEGMGDVQYHIASDGTPKLMEIGARTYGWLPLTIAAGADLPRIAAEALEGRLPGAPVAASAGWHMRWPKGEALRFAEALAPRVRLPPRASRLDVLRQLSPLWGPRMLYDGIGSRDRRLRTGRRPPAYGA
jgi:predicted ATP-grasp superfamily ATP-dependent carboligase